MAAKGCHTPASAASLLGLVAFSPPETTSRVDAELLLLVDTSCALSESEYGKLMEALALSFESGEMVAVIGGGRSGRMSVRLVFYRAGSEEIACICEGEIAGAESAETFAEAIRAGSQGAMPPPQGSGDASLLGFSESAGKRGVFVVAIGGENRLGRTPEWDQAVRGARDAVLESGVEIIGALTVGDPGTVDDYFADNVVGGEVGELVGAVTNVADFDGLEAALPPTLEAFVGALVPEPDSSTLLGMAGMMLARKNRMLEERTM